MCAGFSSLALSLSLSRKSNFACGKTFLLSNEGFEQGWQIILECVVCDEHWQNARLSLTAATPQMRPCQHYFYDRLCVCCCRSFRLASFFQLSSPNSRFSNYAISRLTEAKAYQGSPSLKTEHQMNRQRSRCANLAERKQQKGKGRALISPSKPSSSAPQFHLFRLAWHDATSARIGSRPLST